jgi:hypothetical protein
MDALTDARDLVAERFPDATWAILTGSVLGPDRTAGSDLDIVVLREEEPGYRKSLYFRGWPWSCSCTRRAGWPSPWSGSWPSASRAPIG